MRSAIAAICIFIPYVSVAQETDMHLAPGPNERTTVIIMPGPDAPNQTDTDFGDVPESPMDANPDTTDIIIDPEPLTPQELAE